MPSTSECAHHAPPTTIDPERLQILLYDLRNYAYIESHLLADADEHARHLIADICESGNIDRVKRTLEIAASQIPHHGRYQPQLVHEYLVCRAMADWLEIVYPAFAPKWREKASQAYASLCSQSRRPLLRPLHPF